MIACGLAVFLVLLPARRAWAQGPRPISIHVLGIDSDDAEDQADALTGALRSRVRVAPGLTLQETQHSLAMLTAALRCPPKPDAACLQKIGDQLHAERFVWGYVAKAPGNQVTADIHLWTRGKADASVKETYSDNLHDQNDETLRRIATRMLERLTGTTATSGSITVHAGSADGTVWVDGQKKRALERGSATVDASIGSHTVEVRAKGFAVAHEQVMVNAGEDASVTLHLVPEAATEGTTAEAPHHGVRPRTVLEIGLIGAGVAAGIVAGIEGFQFLQAKNDLDDARANVPSSVADVCSAPANDQASANACKKFNSAKDARTGSIVAGFVGAALVIPGVVLLLTDHPHEDAAPSEEKPAATTGRSLRFAPYASARGGGMDVTLTF
jgi:hypothetical protein